MGFSLDKKAAWLLLHPLKTAAAISLFGLVGGFLAQKLLCQDLFERFGSLTVALSVLAFGIVASELLNRSQDGHYARVEDDRLEPTSAFNIRRTFNFQALLVFAGTIQWGFGSLLFGGTTC
jgi:hypothetical protein|tara:strand:+ start:7828 stop:8190 length:363 start_codon:yes stop_codon:yes gene_type:complete